MAEPPAALEAILEDIRSQLADLATRVTRLEERLEARDSPQPAGLSPAVVLPRPPALTEEKLLAISAAVAAFLGERVRIRQIRLVGSNVWAQQGRLSIQASHQLHFE
jgi:methylmalonyl-CoA carboxyltransferase large subunit